MASENHFGYWKLRGLGQPIRLLLHYSAIDFKEKRYESLDSWFKEKFTLELDFPNVPYWIEGEIKLTESRAILRYLAREKASNLYPDSKEMERNADMLENFLYDLWFSLIRMCVHYTEDMRKTFEKDNPVKFAQLVKFIGNNKFALGDEMKYVDFILYEILYHYSMYGSTYNTDLLKPYPSLISYKENFEKIPAIAEYIASPKHIPKPCINPFAKKPF